MPHEKHDRLDALIARERDWLIVIAQRILRDRHEAEDVVQETLAAVWQAQQRNPPKRLRAYVYRAVRLNALKRFTRQREHAELDEQHDAIQSQPHEPSWDVDPVTLERAVSNLPPAQQAVIRMKYYTGLTFREIANTLAISSNTAASRCRYGLAALRNILTKEKNQ